MQYCLRRGIETRCCAQLRICSIIDGGPVLLISTQSEHTNIENKSSWNDHDDTTSKTIFKTQGTTNTNQTNPKNITNTNHTTITEFIVEFVAGTIPRIDSISWTAQSSVCTTPVSRESYIKVPYLLVTLLHFLLLVTSICCFFHTIYNTYVPVPIYIWILQSQWVRKQRHQKKRKDTGLHSTLNAERETLLTNVGFIWNVHEARWQENYRSLTMYRWYHGHCNVPSNYHDTSLANWAKNQRRQYKQLLVRSSRCCSPATTNDVVAARNNKTLDPHRIEMLNSIGFDWNPREHGYNYNNTNNDGK